MAIVLRRRLWENPAARLRKDFAHGLNNSFAIGSQTLEIGSEEYKHATLLQAADLLLGTIMRSCFVGLSRVTSLPQINDKCTKRDVVSWPVREMLAKKERGAGFRNSGLYRSFTITVVNFSRDGVIFRDVTPKDLAIQDEEGLQMSLFDDVAKAQHRLQRTAASPLGNRAALPVIALVEKVVSPAPPLPLSQTLAIESQ